MSGVSGFGPNILSLLVLIVIKIRIKTKFEVLIKLKLKPPFHSLVQKHPFVTVHL